MTVDKTDYQCVLKDDLWHLTQEQANPPVLKRGEDAGVFTSCSVWASFTRGYEKRMPTCQHCLNAVVFDKGKYGNRKKSEEVEAPERKPLVIPKLEPDEEEIKTNVEEG